MKNMKVKSVDTMRIARNLIVVVLIFLSGFLIGRHVGIPGLSTPPSNVSISGDTKGDLKEIDFGLFWRVWNTLSNEYVDAGKVDLEKMFYGGIKGVVSTFDDSATIFLDPSETRSFNETNAGRYFYGIGAELGYDNGQIIVIAPFAGSPAIKAGIRSGDIILKVDGEEITSSQSIYDVVGKIRGEEGTEVVLTILHKGETKVEDITIKRGQITVPSIEVKDVEGESQIKILDVGRFTDSSLEEWKGNWDEAVTSILDGSSKGLILDLRGNPGGYFDAGTYAANEFVSRGAILAKQSDRQGDQREFKASREGRLKDFPVIILTDGGAASASEILAGALKQNAKIKVVGEKTFGKGTAQSIINLPGGSSLHVTTMKWLLPDGMWLNKENVIVPDVEVLYDEEAFVEGRDVQLERAVTELKKIIK